MSEKIKLTVEKAGSGIRYRKISRGKRWISRVYPADSRRNRSEAWKQFLDWRKEGATIEERAREVVRKATPLIVPDLEITQISLRDDERLRISRQVGADLTRVFSRFESADPLEREEIIKEAERIVAAVEPISEFTMDRQAQRFIDEYRDRFKAKEISAGRYSEVRLLMSKLSDIVGRSFDLRHLDNGKARDVLDTLKRRSSLSPDELEGEDESPLNRTTASKMVTLLRTFLADCHSEHPEIPIPSNLHLRKYNIRPNEGSIDPLTIEEVKLILGNCTERTELYLLLMLNCGFYQGDIAELTADQVDWRLGRIIRQRSKRANAKKGKAKANGGKVNWLLWERTFFLLQKFGNRKGIVLLNTEGNPLVSVNIQPSGKVKRLDAIKLAYDRVISKLKKRGELPQKWHKSLRQLRKTGANLVLKSEDHAEFYQLFLNHSSVSNKAYANGQIVPKFDSAVKFAGSLIGQ